MKQAPIPTIPLADNELARRVAPGRLEFRAAPCRVTWQLGNIVSSDRHEVNCVFECAARIADNPTDRQTAEQVLLSDRPAVTTNDLVARLQGALVAAAGEFAATRKVEELLSADGRQAMLKHLVEQANAAGFACGVELIGPHRLDVNSGSFVRQQLESVERARREERTAQRMEHLKHTAELLKQFESLRASMPFESTALLIERMSVADRGEVLQSLLHASAQQAQTTAQLWAVSGSQLVQIDPRQDPPRLQQVSVPESLGPLRSVRAAEIDGKHVLLVGAQSGVWRIDPADPSSAIAYRDDGGQLQPGIGFNDAVVWRNQIWATHGSAGIVGWTVDAPDSPRLSVRPTRLPIGAGAARISGPRNPRPVGDVRLLFSAHNAVLSLKPDDQVRSVATVDAPVLLIAPGRPDLLIVTAGGSLHRLQPESLRVERDERQLATAAAATVLPWMSGEQRLLLASEAGNVQCVGPDDSVVTEYSGGRRFFRMVAASSDVVAAVTEDRQRVVFWNTWDGRTPLAEVHVTAITRHRVADVEFA
jgi:hypothetical protein